MSEDEFDRFMSDVDAELERVGVDETIDEALGDPQPAPSVFAK